MIREAAQVRGRTTIATAAVAGLELAWLYTFLHATSLGMRLEVSVPSLLLIYAASFVLGLGLRAAFRSSHVTKLLSWLVWPLATLLLLMVLLYPATGPSGASWATMILEALKGITREAEAAAFMVLASGLLWRLGDRLGSSRMTYETVLTEFQIGIVVLAGSVFLGYLVGVDQSAAVLTAVLFVALGLVAAAATRIDDGDGLQFFRQGGTWWAMLLVGVGLVVLLGIVASILFTPELMQFVSRGIRALWGLVDRLLSAIAGLFPSSGPAEMDLPPGPELLPPQGEDEGFTWGLPASWMGPSRIIYGVIIGGLALVALLRAASQLFGWMRRRTGRGGVEVESLPGAFRLDLVRLLSRMLTWVGSLFAFVRLNRTKREEPAGTTAVRRLYVDMLRWGAESGFPRESSQTPFEYQQILCMALPAHRTEVALITESYVRVKYGAESPTVAEICELRENRRRLRTRFGMKLRRQGRTGRVRG
jgi:hypothetical protein